MRELSVAEQRYQAVLAVIADGLGVSQAAEKVGVSRQTLHMWLARYEAEGLDRLGTVRIDRGPRALTCAASADGSTGHRGDRDPPGVRVQSLRQWRGGG